jgi:hypothetical protein
MKESEIKKAISRERETTPLPNTDDLREMDPVGGSREIDRITKE